VRFVETPVFTRDVVDDLTSQQLRILRRLLREEFR
jgi:hypothetical protein